MTAATPMIMPSIVSAVRILLRPSALSAMRRIISTDMGLVPLRRQRWQSRELALSQAPVLDDLVADDLPVAERDDSSTVFRDVGLVRDQHHRDPNLAVQTLANPHDFDA